jgi:hypothetical protein
MWFVGVDWADSKHDILVLDEAGHKLGSRQVAHTVGRTHPTERVSDLH